MSSYKRVGELFGQAEADDLNSSMASLNASKLGVNDMFGDDVKTKGKPVKGYRFLVFTFLMIIALTTITVLNLKDMQ